MTGTKLNKSSLSQEQRALKNYKRFLPSLDLKRQKILIEKNKASLESEKIKNNIDAVKEQISNRLPMLSDEGIVISDLVKVTSIDTTLENVVGIKLPTLKNVQFEEDHFTLFNSPHWLDDFIIEFKKLAELNIQHNLMQKRTQILEKSLQTVTQRKNLFEKVLIPKAIHTIRAIQIFLADNERSAVVRSKITKNKRKLG